MHDYVEIIADLRRRGSEFDKTADAMEELYSMTRRMTSLGVDLEAQIQEDMRPDFYVTSTDSGLTLILTPSEITTLPEFLDHRVPLKLAALKSIGDSFIIFTPNGLEEYYSRDAANQALVQHIGE